jgi:hypothetical protein
MPSELIYTPDLYNSLKNAPVRTASKHEGCYGLQSQFCKEQNYFFTLLSSSRQYFDTPQPLPSSSNLSFIIIWFKALHPVHWESVVKYNQSVATIQVFKAIDVVRNATRSWLKHRSFWAKLCTWKESSLKMEATYFSETPKSVRNNKRVTLKEKTGFMRNVGNYF